MHSGIISSFYINFEGEEVRLQAEWEKQKALLVAYPHQKSDWAYCLDEIEEFYNQFIQTVSRYQECIVLCDSVEIFQQKVKANPNIKAIEIQTNDTWIRDYGPIGEYDFGFNGWGLKFASNFDNQVNRKLFASLKTKNMILEGGSIDLNGKGVMLTTSECLLEANRNPQWDRKKIDKKLKSLFDLEHIIWLENGFLQGDDTDSHIDTLARFVNPSTIAYVQCENSEDIHYKALSKMEQELQQTGFDLIPLPLPRPQFFDGERLPATYCNFVFINGAVIVPTYGEANDKKVLDVFKSLYPKRDIIGLDSRVLIRQHGSIHCASCNLF